MNCLPPADLAYLLDLAFRYGNPVKAGLASPKTLKDLLGGVLGLYAHRQGTSKTGRPTYRLECAHGALILGENDEVPEGRLLITDLLDAELANEKAHTVIDEIESPPLEV